MCVCTYILCGSFKPIFFGRTFCVRWLSFWGNGSEDHNNDLAEVSYEFSNMAYFALKSFCIILQTFWQISCKNSKIKRSYIVFWNLWKCFFFSDDTLGRNRLLVIGKIVVGDFLDQMNWHDIRDRTVGSNLTGIFFQYTCLVWLKKYMMLARVIRGSKYFFFNQTSIALERLIYFE